MKVKLFNFHFINEHTMKIEKKGDDVVTTVVWWRSRALRATCHNSMTVGCERHFLKYPGFSRS